MPEVRFEITWPDGTSETCYSPSRAICEFVVPASTCGVDAFMHGARLGLAAASERVRARYGVPCARAARQLARLEEMAARFGNEPESCVRLGPAFVETVSGRHAS